MRRTEAFYGSWAKPAERKERHGFSMKMLTVRRLRPGGVCPVPKRCSGVTGSWAIQYSMNLRETGPPRCVVKVRELWSDEPERNVWWQLGDDGRPRTSGMLRPILSFADLPNLEEKPSLNTQALFVAPKHTSSS